MIDETRDDLGWGGVEEGQLEVAVRTSHGSRLNRLLHILHHPGPPEKLLEEVKRPVNPRMTGELGGVTPLEDFSLYRAWDEEIIFGPEPGSGYCCLALPTHSMSHMADRTKQEIRMMVSVFGSFCGGSY